MKKCRFYKSRITGSFSLVNDPVDDRENDSVNDRENDSVKVPEDVIAQMTSEHRLVEVRVEV